MDKVRLGIIGVGNMGTGHVKNLKEGKVPELELVAVADRLERQRKWCRDNLAETVQIFEDPLSASGACCESFCKRPPCSV